MTDTHATAAPIRDSRDRDASQTDVLVIGSVNVDLGVHIGRLPRSGETMSSGGAFETGGGKGANQALAAARLGSDVTLLAAVGPDAEVALAPLRTAGVDLSGVLRFDDTMTGRAVLLVTPDDNAIVVAPGANERLSPAHVADRARGTRAPGIVVLQHEVPEATVHAAIRQYAADSRVILNPSPSRSVPAEVLDLVDILVVNEGELADLAGLPTDATGTGLDAAAAERVLGSLPYGDVIVTLGEAGVLVRHDGVITALPAWSVDVVDTVGAGDAFLGALAGALCAGESLVEAARWATAAAAVAVTGVGAHGADLSPAAVRRLLDSAR
ncbi:ribokinase [Plantibacter sp. YIM 135249]|uniref:ribokinase n=1 Tax=Plantibacter sp. YIM 135249 TaxID=3423918 RepID=UPI003D345C09